MNIEELIKAYSEELYSKMPIFFRYLELINVYAGYLTQIEDYMDGKVKDNKTYSTNIDYQSLVEITNEILSSLDSDLCHKFNQSLVDGTIDFDEDESAITSMSIVDKRVNITVKKTYTIEDILGLIHEFFHSIHIEKYNNNMEDPNFYFFTEAVAMIGEIYSILYMHKNNIMKSDLIVYINKYLSTIFYHANTTLITGLSLEIYDCEQSLSNDAVSHFLTVKQLPKEYSEITNILEELEDFPFLESSTYIFGFPISCLISFKMLEDENYKDKVIYLLKNIKEYSLEELLTSLKVGDILNNEDYICAIMNYICTISEQLLIQEQVDIKSLLKEKR